MEMNRAFEEIMESLGSLSISEFAGDENKENKPCTILPVPRPVRRTPRQAPKASRKYRLGPRIEISKNDLDFAMYRDETAHDIPPPQRQYYGSNLPALPELKNGEKFNYALPHELRHRFEPLMDEAYAKGDLDTMEKLLDNYYDYVPIRERTTGLYHWTAGSNPLDVWLWVKDNGYHRTWAPVQEKSFQCFLKWMGRVICEAAGCCIKNPAESKLLDEENSRNIPAGFESLNLPNLTIEKANMVYVYFIPSGVDKHIIHRYDFTEEEQEFIDKRWPEHWAPEEEEPPLLEDDKSGEEEDDDDGDDDNEEEEEEEEHVFEGDNLIIL
ncbi:hypothetical protein V8C37DRAFT_77775 [Trichoderma ceciliae]